MMGVMDILFTAAQRRALCVKALEIQDRQSRGVVSSRQNAKLVARNYWKA